MEIEQQLEKEGSCASESLPKVVSTVYREGRMPVDHQYSLDLATELNDCSMHVAVLIPGWSASSQRMPYPRLCCHITK